MMKLLHKYMVYFVIFFLLKTPYVYTQIKNDNFVDYNEQKRYQLGGIKVSGIKYINEDIIINISGLKIGDTIEVPGEKISKAITKIWSQGLFSEVSVKIDRIIDSTIFLEFVIAERPRLSKYSFTGISKSEADDLKEKLKLSRGSQVTDNTIKSAKYIIAKHFKEKGFYNVKVDVQQFPDSSLQNYVELKFIINKNKKYKIADIQFIGENIVNNCIYDSTLKSFFNLKKYKKISLRKAMKETKVKKWYRIFKVSRYTDDNFNEDKKKVIEKLNQWGYRDAIITKDSVFMISDKLLKIVIHINTGNKYFFRNIRWYGNSIYSTDTLEKFLGIKRGDVYNQSLLENRLFTDVNSVLSLYQDNGYLFASINVVENNVENDSIDIDLHVYEGKKATINKVSITGNTKTHENVIRREMYSKPGQLYSRSDIIRTMRELASLNYFDPEKLDIKQDPNPQEGTVNLEYIVEEKPSDQLELSGGWGGRMVVGTIGVAFNNFSAKDFFKASAWKPLPSGGGQRLTLRAQTNGLYYTAITASFVEPWLGGKKPNSLSISTYYTMQSNGVSRKDKGRQEMDIIGASVGLGKRIKWPDDFFSLYYELSYQRYILKNYRYGYLFSFYNGYSNNFNGRIVFQRNSVDQPIYPRRGSLVSLSVQFTPPYSLLSDKDYKTLTDQQKYKWIEYHKWSINTSFFTNLTKNFVLNTKLEFGFLAMYNKDYGFSPFESYNMGGDGLITYNLYGKETIALRGYGNGSLTPLKGGNIYNKFTFEVRYPLSLNPNATFYVLAFLEGGNCFTNFNEFSPFNFKRSAGLGIRIFLPMFGKLGVDWGYGFDEPVIPGENKSQFHFIIGQNF
ncbi:MAG: outer membrane protein assembly factor BamA [Bacteroidales bacterium]|nr:outer membrane protein assembly factor BamA [Bacteroidales bacterium]